MYKDDSIRIRWLHVGFAPSIKQVNLSALLFSSFGIATCLTLSAARRGKAKLALGWQKRVSHTHSDVQAQAALMCKRGLKHKEVGPARSVPAMPDRVDMETPVHQLGLEYARRAIEVHVLRCSPQSHQ